DLERVRELLAFFCCRHSRNRRRQDCCPLLEGATKANPVKAGDTKLRGYRTPSVPRRSSRRTSRRRGHAFLRTKLGNGRRWARAARGVRTPVESDSAAGGLPSGANRPLAVERDTRSVSDPTIPRIRSHDGRR